MPPISRFAPPLGALCLLVAAGEAAAGAFQLREGSAAALGSSLAGRTSGDRDVSFALYNPAAFRTVETFEVSAGVAGVFAVTDAQAVNTPPIPGLTTSDDAGETAAVPGFAMGWRYDEHVVFGLTARSPFGLATKYSRDFVGGVAGVDSELLTIAVTPTVAVEPVPGFAFGVGATIQYADARLSNLNGALQEQDVAGDDISYGFNVGVLADVAPRTTIGAAFTWGVSHELEGSFSDNFQPGVFSGDGKAEIDLPAVFSIGVTHGFTDDFRAMAEVEWIGWSAYDSILITDSDSGAQINDVQDYDDAFMIAAGAEYDVSDAFTVRAGVAYDKTPSVDEHRSVRVPDADRYWASAGFSYAITETFGVDAAYTFIYFDDTSVTKLPAAIGGGAGARIDYNDSQAHVVSLNATYRF